MIGAALALLAAAGVVLREHGVSSAFKKIVGAAGCCLGWLLWNAVKGGAS
jgi:hypothetical protein